MLQVLVSHLPAIANDKHSTEMTRVMDSSRTRIRTSWLDLDPTIWPNWTWSLKRSAVFLQCRKSQRPINVVDHIRGKYRRSGTAEAMSPQKDKTA